MKRCAAGSYVITSSRTTYYRIERGWAEKPGTDRRRQVWILAHVTNDVADIVSEHATLRDARATAMRAIAKPQR